MIVFVAVMVTDEVTVEAAVLLLGAEQPARKIAVATIAAATLPPCITLSPCFNVIRRRSVAPAAPLRSQPIPDVMVRLTDFDRRCGRVAVVALEDWRFNATGPSTVRLHRAVAVQRAE